jgi:predicted ATPase
MEGHPLYLLLDDLQKSEKAVALPVRPLEEEHVAAMLADALCHTADRVQPLAGIVYKKTQGNPFFVRKLLLHLHDGHYIRFNGETRQWEWDAEEIESIGISDNIVDFMIGQILKLPPETQDMLKLAALVGSSFDLKILSTVADIPAPELAASLREAVEGEIILPDGNDYTMTEALQAVELNVRFRFAHDRVQQACAALMEENEPH